MTNSLCIHYLAFHRGEVPPVELTKVEALSDGEAERTAAELVAPPLEDPRPWSARRIDSPGAGS